MRTSEQEQPLKAALIEAAARIIASQGLAGLKARNLAQEAGCALVAIYNAFPNLDTLILEFNLRTLALFDSHIAQVQPAASGDGGELEAGAMPASDGMPSGGDAWPAGDVKAAIADLTRLAAAYLTFASEHRQRWGALFQHRIAGGRAPPDWYRVNQARLFRHIEQPLHVLCPHLAQPERELLARTLFSATHGMVSLGLDEKLMSLPLPSLRQQIELVIGAAARGLVSGDLSRLTVA